MTSLLTTPAGIVVGGGMAVGSTTQFALAGYHEDGSPDTTLNPANTTAANANNLVVGTGGPDRIAALALTPQGRILAAGTSQTPSEQNLSAIVRLGGDAHSPQGAVKVTWEQAVPGRAVRPGQTVGFDASASTDPDGPIAKYEWDIDGDGTFERTGVKVLGSYPAPTVAGVTLRVTDADGLTAVSGATVIVAERPGADRQLHQPGQGPGRGRAVHVRRRRHRPRRQRRRLRVRLRRQRHLRDPATLPLATTTFLQKGPASVGVRVTDDEGATATAKLNVTVKDAPCVDNPTIKVERAVIVTQGADVAGGAGCFHGVTTTKDGVKTTVWTTSGHFRVNGLEVDTLADLRGEARVEAQGHRPRSRSSSPRPRSRSSGTAKQTDFTFHEGAIAWDLEGTTIGGFVVDPTAGIGGLPLKVLGPPQLKTDGSSTLDVLPGMPPELLGKTPSAPDHLVFGPSANASALGAFSFHVDQIPLGVILLGPVTVTYDGAGNWLIEAEATIPYPIPTKVKGRLVIVNGHVKEVDLELQGALPTPTPVVINALGVHIDFGPKVSAKPECVKTVGLVETTPYDVYKALDYYIPILRQLAHDNPQFYGSLFHKTFQRYPVPTFALCGHIELSLAEVLDADVGFGFARYDNPLPEPLLLPRQGDDREGHQRPDRRRVHHRGLRALRRRGQGRLPDERPVGQVGHRARLRVLQEAVQRRGARGARDRRRWTSPPARTCSCPTRAWPPACTSRRSSGTWRPGAGAMWGHGPTLYLFGCDVKDYKVVIQHALSGDTVIGDIVPKAASASSLRLPTGGHGNSAGLISTAARRPPRPRRPAPDPVDTPRRAARHGDGVQGRRRARRT